MHKLFVAAGLALLLAAAPAARGQESGQVLVELVFGLSSADGSGVSEQAWDTWVADVLAPAVPGFTVMDCRGGWRQDGRLMREGCKYVLILIDRADTAALAEAVADYRQRFEQHSVLWLERPCPGSACRFE
jgi:hypothetical protein